MYESGLDVMTTVDLDWQQAAERLARLQLNHLNNPVAPGEVPANANNAAIVAIDPFTGQVLTMLGSPDYFNEGIDGAVNAALGAAAAGERAEAVHLRGGVRSRIQANPWTAATMILDVATPFVTRELQSYSPGNFGLVEHGPVLIREALASSFNIPAVVTLDHVGIPAMVQLCGGRGADFAGAEHERGAVDHARRGRGAAAGLGAGVQHLPERRVSRRAIDDPEGDG